MSGFVLSVFIILLAFVFVMRIANRIPKTGRYNSAAGEKIEAVLTNENRTAEKAATMKLMDKDGRKYRVKLKADEARLWIKGDTVEILLSENKRIYRVLFNDYFRNNEERIRQHAVQRLEKIVKRGIISTRLVGTQKESLQAFVSSEADSRVIFIFATFMRMIDTYSIASFFATLLFLIWRSAVKPAFSQMAFPLVVVIIAYLMIYSAVTTCKGLLKKYTK